MEFNGNTLKIKTKLFAIDNIKDVTYSEEVITYRAFTIPLIFIFTIVMFFKINTLLILLYTILIALSFFKRTKYLIIIDNRFQDAYSTFDEDNFLAYKKTLEYSRQKKKESIPIIKKEKNIESIKEYKLRKRKEAFNKNLKEQKEVYKKYQEENQEDTEDNETEENLESKPKMPKKKEKNDDYEKKVAGYYKLDGYDIYFNGIKKDRLENEIDLICKKDDEVILIQCEEWNPSRESNITDIDIKIFQINCIKYTEQKNLTNSKIKLKYIVSNIKIFDAPAMDIFKEEYHNCKYEILEF